MLWLLVPALLVCGAGVALVAIRSLEAARRELQQHVAGLAASRAAISPVQREITALRATAVARDRR